MTVFSLCHLTPSGWFYQNQLDFTRILNESFLPAADLTTHTFQPALARQGAERVQREFENISRYNILACVVFALPDRSDAAEKFAFTQSSVDLARVAIALERYRLAHEKYPDTLAVLEPQFLNPVPHDVIGGAPLHYRLTKDGQFVLYSIGWNDEDDGGKVALALDFPRRQDLSSGDWVWRYPPP